MPEGAVSHLDDGPVSLLDDGPVSLLGTASVAAVAEAQGTVVEPVRFRANVLLSTAEPYAEERLVGRRLALGTALLEVVMPLPRCAMVDAATADLPAQPGNLRAVGALNDAHLAVVADVVESGWIAVGDRLRPC